MNRRLFFLPVDHYSSEGGYWWLHILKPSMGSLLQALDERLSGVISPEATLVVASVNDFHTINLCSSWLFMQAGSSDQVENLSIAEVASEKTNIVFAGSVDALRDVSGCFPGQCMWMPGEWYERIASSTESRNLYEIVGDAERPVRGFQHLETGFVIDSDSLLEPIRKRGLQHLVMGKGWADSFNYPNFAAGGDGAMG